jgi:hypothetical protein
MITHAGREAAKTKAGTQPPHGREGVYSGTICRDFKPGKEMEEGVSHAAAVGRQTDN